jgi:hypothetical protein
MCDVRARLTRAALQDSSCVDEVEVVKMVDSTLGVVELEVAFAVKRTQR